MNFTRLFRQPAYIYCWGNLPEMLDIPGQYKTWPQPAAVLNDYVKSFVSTWKHYDNQLDFLCVVLQLSWLRQYYWLSEPIFCYCPTLGVL
jgi:hypothetical protein